MSFPVVMHLSVQRFGGAAWPASGAAPTCARSPAHPSPAADCRGLPCPGVRVGSTLCLTRCHMPWTGRRGRAPLAGNPSAHPSPHHPPRPRHSTWGAPRSCRQHPPSQTGVPFPTGPPGPESLRTGAPAPPLGEDSGPGGRGAHPQQLPVAADEDADVVLAVPPLGQGQVAAIPGKGDSCQEEDRAGIKGPDRRRTRVLSKEEGGAAQADTATRGRVRCGLAPTGPVRRGSCPRTRSGCIRSPGLSWRQDTGHRDLSSGPACPYASLVTSAPNP